MSITSSPIHVISLGAGVQSSTMALMAAETPFFAQFAGEEGFGNECEGMCGV